MEYIILFAILAIIAGFVVPHIREKARMRRAKIVNTLHLGPSQGRLYEVPEDDVVDHHIQATPGATVFATVGVSSYVSQDEVDLIEEYPQEVEEDIEYDFLVVEDEDFEDTPSYDN